MRLTDDDLVLAPTSGSAEFTGWAVQFAGERIGTVALRSEEKGVLSVRWNLRSDGDSTTWLAARSVRLVLAHAFTALGATRVEARVPVDRPDDVRAASIGGLRREGIVRGVDSDRVLMARLAGDPPADSRDGFIALLNAGLPRKRLIAQGLLRDESGRVLLCRLTYKTEWDLPGGVVEAGEAPAAGLARELREELDLTTRPGRLLTVNWLPAWRGWDDACVFLFDLGTMPANSTDDFTLEPTEIAGVEWCGPDDVAAHATAAARELLGAVAGGDLPPYREAPEQT